MHKRLANHPIFQPTNHDLVDKLQSALGRWKEAMTASWIRRRRAEIVSELSAQTLYDIGESDCRPVRRPMPVWNNHPYMVMTALVQDDLSRFNSTR
jgi:hypothetical protein